jgi:integration host factor subunit beta
MPQVLSAADHFALAGIRRILQNAGQKRRQPKILIRLLFLGKDSIVKKMSVPRTDGQEIFRGRRCRQELAMNKRELIKALAEENALSADEAALVVNALFDGIRQALLAGKRVEIRGFGSFKIKEYKAYSGRNPKTGEIVAVAPKKLPFFRAGKDLKEFLNS